MYLLWFCVIHGAGDVTMVSCVLVPMGNSDSTHMFLFVVFVFVVVRNQGVCFWVVCFICSCLLQINFLQIIFGNVKLLCVAVTCVCFSNAILGRTAMRVHLAVTRLEVYCRPYVILGIPRQRPRESAKHFCETGLPIECASECEMPIRITFYLQFEFETCMRAVNISTLVAARKACRDGFAKI